MRKRDIKIDKYYYVVHDIKQLYCKDFPVKSLVEIFKMNRLKDAIQHININGVMYNG